MTPSSYGNQEVVYKLLKQELHTRSSQRGQKRKIYIVGSGHATGGNTIYHCGSSPHIEPASQTVVEYKLPTVTTNAT